MSRVNATRTATPPRAPRDPERPNKGFVAKLIERTTRAIKQVNELQVRTRALHALDGKHATHGTAVSIVGGSVDEASQSLHEVLETLSELDEAGYAPTIKVGRPTLAAGTQVWLRSGVWVRKYAPMFKPEELDGLEIVAVSGKVARAKSASGVQITEPVGAFTTTATSYEVSAA
jgi:hypothetical protein